MKRMMSIAAIALMMAGSSAFACDGCGCSGKKAEKKKAECSESCKKDKEGEKCAKSEKDKKCAKDKTCGCAKKAADNKKTAEAETAE